MSRQEIIKIFGDRKIRSVWDDEAEIWYFSIVDVVAVLTRCRIRNFPSSRRWRITDGWDILRSGLPAASSLLTFART